VSRRRDALALALVAAGGLATWAVLAAVSGSERGEAEPLRPGTWSPPPREERPLLPTETDAGVGDPDGSPAPSPAGAATPSPDGDATTPPSLAERLGDTASLRGVRGVVRDARTGAPIEGALVSWRPPPLADVERLASLGALAAAPGDREFGMVTDHAGRFDVPRLADDVRPVARRLWALAPGYAHDAVEVGLRRDVVFELEAAGSLRVLVAGLPPDHVGRLELVPLDRDAPARAAGLPQDVVRDVVEPTAAEATTLRYAPLAPGRYDLRLDDVGRDVVVRAGEEATVELEAPPGLELAGVVRDAAGEPIAWAELRFVELDRGLAWRTEAFHGGEYAIALEPGRWAAYLAESSERELRLEPRTLGGRGPHDLKASGERAPFALALSVDGAPPANTFHVALVHLETQELVPLRNDGPGRYAGRVRPGRHVVLAMDGLAGEIEVAPGGVVRLDVTTVTARFSWRLPAELAEDEALRGTVWIDPAGLTSLRPDLQGDWRRSNRHSLRFRRGGELELRGFEPGEYVVEATTDLGRVTRSVELAPGPPVEVELDLRPDR